jgi:hypothetical protein
MTSILTPFEGVVVVLIVHCHLGISMDVLTGSDDLRRLDTVFILTAQMEGRYID